MATPSFVLYEEGFTAPVRVQGLTPAGMIGLSVPIGIGDRTSYWGKPLHETGVPASITGALDAVIDAGQTHLIVLLTSELVRRSLGPEQAALLEATAATRVLPAGACRMERLRGWLLGTLADVLVVRQLALVGILEARVWTALGTRAMIDLRFPLGFLWFAVPIGEFLVPPLQDFTAVFAAKRRICA